MAEQQLPVWNNEGVEPPANLQIDGWQPGVKPPAQYFDWLFNRAYKCLEELQAITEALETNKANGTDLTTLNNKVTQHLDEIASPSELGHVKIGQGLTISEDGTLNAEAQAVPNASTTIAGITKLNDSLTSTSTTEAATPNAVKKINDAKLNKAGDTMTGDLTINKGIPRVYLQVPGVDYTTEFRNNASPTNDFGFDIYRKDIRALHISPSGAVWVRDNGGVEFNLADLKSSVSNGKSAIASAISDGGVYTSPIASFADMANNIRQLASSGYKMATGSSPNVQVVLDVPAGTFGFTPKVILTRALGIAYLWATQYIKADAFYPGSVGMGETSARDLSGSTDYVDETYGSTILRAGGFRINATTANTYPSGGTAVNWWAFG